MAISEHRIFCENNHVGSFDPADISAKTIYCPIAGQGEGKFPYFVARGTVVTGHRLGCRHCTEIKKDIFVTTG